MIGKNIICIAIAVIVFMACTKQEQKPSKANTSFYYIETVGFDNELEARLKKGIVNTYSSYYENRYFDLQEVEPTLNDSNFYIFKYLDANTLPEANFVDDLHKIRICYYKSDSLLNNKYTVEVFKSEDAGKWRRVRNMGNIFIYHNTTDTTLSDEELCERMRTSLVVGMWK